MALLCIQTRQERQANEMTLLKRGVRSAGTRPFEPRVPSAVRESSMSTPYELLVKHFQLRYPLSNVTRHLATTALPPELAVRHLVPPWDDRVVHYAFRADDDEAIILAVRAGEDPNADISAHKTETRALLAGVVGMGNLDSVRTLVELGADINHSANGAITPLIKACHLPNARDMVSALLEMGADPNVERGQSSLDSYHEHHHGESALSVAIKSPEDTTLMDVLIIQGGADPHRLEACQISRAKPACLRSLLEMYCVAPDARKGYGETPLSLICGNSSRHRSDVAKNQELISILLAAGADPGLVDESFRDQLPPESTLGLPPWNK